MKVTHIEVHRIHPEYDDLVAAELNRFHGASTRTVYIAHTDTGLEGLGESSGEGEPAEILQRYEPAGSESISALVMI